MNLDRELDEIASYLDKTDRSALRVSNSTVGWQIAHMLKVIDSVCTAVATTDPDKYRWKFNLSRLIILTTGHIPRGKAKAPKVAVPRESELSREGIEQMLEQVRVKLNDLSTLHKHSYFKHPYFGLLHVNHTRRFLQVHTRHHLKIVRDILAEAD